jgi:hypothetical protein
VKKIWVIVALAGLCGLTAKSFADVQNIRLSGDIRLRGYFLDDAGEYASTSPNAGEQQSASASFIEQRTRVCVEADLEDHVLVVVTLKAESLWGGDNEAVHNSGGAGSQQFDGAINRSWDTGIDEAYLQLNEVFYTAATLKIGRQYLNYGHGLILSSVDQEYNYDAGRLVLDYYPFTLDIVGAEVVNQQSFAATAGNNSLANNGLVPSADLLFINARYEMTDSLLKDVEFYYGWLMQGGSHPIYGGNTRVPPTMGGSTTNTTGGSPMIIGARTDLNLTEAISTWGEAAYEFGDNGNPNTGAISAFLANLGIKIGQKGLPMSPTINASYTIASGGGVNGNNNFVPWFDYVDGYNGYLFCPRLSNLQILNAGASIKPWENTTLALQAYYYMKVESDVDVASNPNVDFGGPGFVSSSNGSRDVGWEFDGILGYDYSKDVRTQLVYAMFLPGRAYLGTACNAAQEVRAEVDVKF